MTVSRVKLGEKEIVLIGTAHISKASVDLVQKTIENEKPDVIGVELDEMRLKQLLGGTKWENTNVLTLIQEGQSGLVLLNLFLANMQRQLGDQVGVKPGEEMMIGVRLAQEKKTPVLLLDRNIQTTMKRAMHAVSLWHKIKLLGSLVVGLFEKPSQLNPEQVEKLKENDMITHLMHQLSQQYPTLKRTLVDERDAYIAHGLISTPAKKIVAVLGAGHVQGVLHYLHSAAKKEKNADDKPMPGMDELTHMPKPANWGKIIEYGIPLVFLGVMAYIFIEKGVQGSIHFLFFWIMGHGVLAALGSLLAGAHWTTAIGVFLTAWIAALHPLIAAGWIAAALEVKRQAPNMKDFTSLNQLSSLTDFTKNRVTQLLLITALANVGSMLATVLVIPYLVQVLG